MSDTFEQKAILFAQRFADLSRFADNLAFPDYRKGIFEPRHISQWIWPAKYIYNSSHPFTTDDQTGIGTNIIGLLFAYVSFIFGLVWLTPNVLNIPHFFPAQDLQSKTVITLSFVFGIPTAITGYFWLVDILFISRKKPWQLKAVLVVAIAMLIHYVISAMVRMSPSTSILESTGEFQSVAIAFGVFLIPSTSYFMAIAYDIFLVVALFIRTVFGGFTSIHNPLPLKHVMQLATGSIPSDNQKGDMWKLSDLSKAEVHQLREWAEANRESSEKRTIPASLTLAVIGALLASEYVSRPVNGFIITLISNVQKIMSATSLTISWQDYIAFFVLMLVVFLIMDIFKKLSALLRNLIAQNLIVEACIVAESSMPDPQPTTPKSSGMEIITRFLRDFFKL